MAASPQPTLSPADYLAIDRASETRHEYADGLMVAMSGGTANHSFLIQAMGRELSLALRDRPCNVSVATLRLQIASGRSHLYPDAMVICGPLHFPEGQRDMITNPTVIVEVLSDSTERWDRVGKFARYRQVDSLREYVLVAQDEMSIEWYTRRDDGEWVYHAATGPDGALHLHSLDVTLALAEIYSKLDLT